MIIISLPLRTSKALFSFFSLSLLNHFQTKSLRIAAFKIIPVKLSRTEIYSQRPAGTNLFSVSRTYKAEVKLSGDLSEDSPLLPLYQILTAGIFFSNNS